MNRRHQLSPATGAKVAIWIYHSILAGACLWVWIVGTLRSDAQDVYLMDFPEAREHMDHALWAVNERIGFRAEFAGEADQACQPGIVARVASQAEWTTRAPPPEAHAFVDVCPMPDAYQIIWNPNQPPTRAVVLHEMGHAMGCWRHIPYTLIEHLTGIGSVNVLAAGAQSWAALTVADVDCILEGEFWDLYAEPDMCFVELMPNFDLIAPDAMGHYTRLAFIGDIETGEYLWEVGRRVAVGGICDSVRVSGGQIVLDDVRGQWWQGSVIIAPEGNLWRLVWAGV